MEEIIDEINLEDLEDLKENRVIVRVWRSKCSDDGKFESIGHISIQTSRYYMSLWPLDEEAAKKAKDEASKSLHADQVQNKDLYPAPHLSGKDIGRVFKEHFVASFKEDCNKEKRLPDEVFYFFKLSASRINAKFNAFKINPKGWTIIPLGIRTAGAESCASLAYALLEAGNFSECYCSKLKQAVVSAVQSSQQSTVSSVGLSVGIAGFISSNRKAALQGFGDSMIAGLNAVENLFGIVIESPDALANVLKIAQKAEKEYFQKRGLWTDLISDDIEMKSVNPERNSGLSSK